MLSQPVPSQLGQVLPFLRCQKAAANHGAEKNPSAPVWQAVFSTSHGVTVYVHPKRPVLNNDLVVNRVSWSPLVFYLRQSDDGDLYGLTLSKKRVDLQADDIDRLHKVAGIWMISTSID